ncbi:YigZ family protein [Apilactobacillus xinyiensis]|uniref:YigZ family protein n=1 Tax=Apilactobacillus xinyiensis TaxID=2841032 RepID=UPI001C7D4213|nr:YigZ family protein [Apilactobacillus xinyiensis]MCL0312665.1 YigZ family protein [Apilactobacillus xinyiensis]MCL0319056.1 YigZ family protein [Apilactobacillus xinyiensis]MCL0330291.1 YigZ family protein [Apilactobacillus xinyiensis]
MVEKYLTIKKSGSHEIIIKKSQFICNIARIKDEAEANDFIDNIKEQHKKATHNCYAYIIGKDDHIQRASDNGEPTGTAGVPILEAIKLNELHNIVAVVTRYFGGIKLGAGGLIRAYSNATSSTIDNLGIVNKILQTQIDILVDYSLFDKLNYYLSENNINVIDTTYTSKVTISVSVDKEKIESFQNSIINLLADRVEFKIGEDQYFEVEYKKD